MYMMRLDNVGRIEMERQFSQSKRCRELRGIVTRLEET